VIADLSGAHLEAVLEAGLHVVKVSHEELIEDGRAEDDSTAGVAATLAQGGDLELAVRTGAAAGALNVTRHGLGTGHVDAVRVLTDRVRLTPIEAD